MNEQMHIDFDADSNKFIIRCPFWANSIVHTLPDCRWSKSKRAWTASRLRQNVDGLRRVVVMPGVALSDNARTALDSYEDPQMRRGTGFPSWYPFKMPPRKHQKAVLDKKYGLPVFALHHDRGTGKTKTEIDNACALRMEGKIDAMLVAVKLSGRRTWQEQFEEHAPIPYDLFLPDTGKPKLLERWLGKKHDFKIMVIGIESLSQGRMYDYANRFMLSHGKIKMVVDESHLILNHRAERTERVTKLGLLAAYRDTMTGTPISTGPLNLFAQFQFLDPDIIGIGDFYAFRNRYAIVIKQQTKAGQKFPMIVGYQNLEELTKLVAPYTSEVKKSEVLDLPPKTYEKLYVQLSPTQRELYDRVKKEKMYEWKGKTMVTKNVLEVALRLHQIAGGFVTTYREEETRGKVKRFSDWHAIIPWKKNPKIIELLDVAADDKQFIIWAAYRPEIAAIVAALEDSFPKERVVQVHGDISEADRATYRAQYQKGSVKFMVGNTATGGSSDTWTACETMVYFNNTDRMIDREQSEDRAHRDGLTHPVLYIDIIAEETVDVTIVKSIEQKVDLSEYIRRNIKDADKLLAGAA